MWDKIIANQTEIQVNNVRQGEFLPYHIAYDTMEKLDIVIKHLNVQGTFQKLNNSEEHYHITVLRVKMLLGYFLKLS